jgi:methionyl-tRNA formyltransferase
MKNIRVVFMGTPEFAVPALRGLAAAFNVVLVVTQPDRPRGRGLLSAPTPVKKAAEELGLNVIQPVKLKDGALTANLAALEPDFIVTSAYGRILPPEILAVPVITALNIHASLLPRYRGAAPIHRTVINGDSESGITIMYMDEGMDTGDILVQRSVPIGRDMTSGELHDILAILGADMIVPAITSIVSGSAGRFKQDDALATNALPLAPGEEEIDWCASAVSVHNLVRGMNPWPGAYTLFNGKRMKIWSGRPEEAGCHHPGTVLEACGSGILVAAGSGAYRITRLQPPGKRVMSAAEYLCGNLLVNADTPGRGEYDGSP